MSMLYISLNPPTRKQFCNRLPVWPVYNLSDLEDLIQICAFYNSSPCIVEHFDLNTPEYDIQQQYVVGIKGHYEEDIDLYCHLTRRRALFVEQIKDVYNLLICPSVYILPYKDISPELINFIYCVQSQDVAPGLIIIYNEELVRKQILCKSAAAYLSEHDSDNCVVDTHCIFPLQDFSDASYILCGNKLIEDHELLSLLQRKKSLFILTTHSNGVNAQILGRTLCDVANLSHNKHLNCPPLCVQTGQCYLYDQSISDAAQSFKIISTDKIRANIFCFLGCRGLRFPSDIVDPQWGIGVGFLENCFIGTCITTWKHVFITLDMVILLCRLLDRFKIVAKSVAIFNRIQSKKKTGTKLCILGDPRVYFPGNKKMTQIQNSLLKHKPVHPVSQFARSFHSKDGMISKFLKYHLSLFFDNANSTMRAKIFHCLRLLNLTELDTLHSTMPKSKLSKLATLRRNLVEIFADQPNILLPYNTSTLSDEKNVCFVCGENIDTHYMSYQHIPAVERVVSICPNCGVLEDKQKGMPTIKIKLEGHTIELESQGLAELSWDAQLSIWYASPKYFLSEAWQEKLTKTPLNQHLISSNLFEGACHVCIFYISEFSYSVVRVPHRFKNFNQSVLRHQ